jgi:hypothetical protein
MYALVVETREKIMSKVMEEVSVTNEEKALEAAEFSKEIPDDDLEQAAGGSSPLPGEFAIIPNPFSGFVRVVNATGTIRILDVPGTLVKQVTAAGGETIIPTDGLGRGTYIFQNNGRTLKGIHK